MLSFVWICLAITNNNTRTELMHWCIALTDISQDRNEKPTQQLLSRYPSKLQSGAKRSFQSAWYEQHEWLEYSQKLDAAFCYACRHFSVPGSCPDRAFTVNGFNNWKKAQYTDGGFSSHCKSECHVQAFIAWRDCKNRDASKSVFSLLTDERTHQIKDNRHYIGVVVDLLKFTCVHRLAQRGHDESEESSNAGNFLDLLKLIGTYDEVVGKRLVVCHVMR